MSEKVEFCCPICSATKHRDVFTYTAPPKVETSYSFCEGQKYYREIKQCCACNHFVSIHSMDTADLYSEDYVSSTYSDLEGVTKTFQKIINLPPERSDNVGRVKRIVAFASKHFNNQNVSVLDIGAGLGVFPYQLKRDTSWNISALDPDARATEHIKNSVGVTTITADFLTAKIDEKYHLVTLNKVLEHVTDPILMLKKVNEILLPNGLVYVELPDGEMAANDGKEREEFTIDHPHIFSAESLRILAVNAGFNPLGVERLRDPSGKYTLYSFLSTR